VADDRRPSTPYLQVVHTWFSRLRHFRPDPVTVDWTLAALLTVGTELAIWLGVDALTTGSGPR
jgi:hypothetical protein